ncbi:MAG: helix-turn-helix domain-containing protein [Erysipelotrichaceae bacterium]|nr:helix-turn-helix domain-containing protein [Erysipelotrichaceae bacterium]
MKETYNLNEISVMCDLSTRTLRNYLNQGLLKGNKIDGAWAFTLQDIEQFLKEPFVKESIRIKRNSKVLYFLADRDRKNDQSCTIIDRKVTVTQGNELSDFFCELMKEAEGVEFSYDYSKGNCRIILTGDHDQIRKIMKAYYDSRFCM